MILILIGLGVVVEFYPVHIGGGFKNDELGGRTLSFIPSPVLPGCPVHNLRERCSTGTSVNYPQQTALYI